MTTRNGEQLKSLADLSQSDVERILGIVDRLNDIEIRLELDGMKLHVRKFSEASGMAASIPALGTGAQVPHATRLAAPAAAASTDPVAANSTNAVAPTQAAEPGLLEIRSPMLGRFYRSASPSDPAFVQIGSRVQPEDTVCIVEVMKLFNTIRAEVSGTIVEILVENGAMVEADAVLFRVRSE